MWQIFEKGGIRASQCTITVIVTDRHAEIFGIGKGTGERHGEAKKEGWAVKRQWEGTGRELKRSAQKPFHASIILLESALATISNAPHRNGCIIDAQS
jgi:hypothetical protein